MKLPQWLLGTTDGQNFVISTDEGDMPYGGVTVKVAQAPTKNQVDTLVNSGCNVRVIPPRGEHDSR